MGSREFLCFPFISGIIPISANDNYTLTFESVVYLNGQMMSNKFTFVGDEFGYTGTTSPLLAYAKAVENNELEIGDNVIFWTLGAGLNCVSLLYKY